jgi:valyl-tRNA synthetase
MSEIPKHYDPAAIEQKWYAAWLRERAFHGDPAVGGEPYCIVIPPPNVTGILHMGHALNDTIQDVLIRWRRMEGRNAVWVPGTDHAGIATQSVVERALAKEGTDREALGREKFLERVWAWREEYGGTIIRQLKQLGCACDWERERFTMDEGLSDAVTEAFVRLYDKGLIYRGQYIVNWCPKSRTALSDEEVEHKTVQGKLYHIRYPARDDASAGLTVATTRPETMLGDAAVAVNPRDERYQSWIGKTLVLPILEREIPVIADDFVDPAFGTGAVKVTPAHDPNDFAMGQRHDLPRINVMNDDGSMNEQAGPYRGLDRAECRRRLVEDLQKEGRIEAIEEHVHSVGHNYRYPDVMIEPRLSPQWFVRMKPLAEPAIEAVRDGRVRFVPDRWTKVYMEWMENIRDWCISRQIWWGHRIPVFTCQSCGHEWAARAAPHACPSCRSERIEQDPDVLDTWFSSWLWPFTVFGWPEKTEDLSFYYPTHALATASEIIFFWVARMIMSGLEFMGEVPFQTVYIHGTVRDDGGRKMSKSLGNSIDPLEIIEKYSADALRFSLMMLTATGQDVYVSDEKFEVGRNFGTKIWNVARFLQMQDADFRCDIDRPALDAARLSTDDRHILAKLHEAIAESTDHLAKFRFNDAAKTLYEFLWHQVCDRYVETCKSVLQGGDGARREQTLTVLHTVFAHGLKLLHPFMPFLTEELWHAMGYAEGRGSIQFARWPVALDAEELAVWGVDEEDVRFVDAKHDLIRAARVLMSDYNLLPRHGVRFVLRATDRAVEDRVRADLDSILALTRAESFDVRSNFEAREAMPSLLTRLGAVYMPVEGLIDIEAETKRLAGQLEKIEGDLQRTTRKLENMDFVRKAPEDVVAREERRKKDLLEKRDKLRKLKDALGR